MVFTFKVMRTKQTFELQLELEDNIQLYDIAEYFLEIEEILSMNIGIYSQNKQYYTENQAESLLEIGTGPGDTYILLEGDLKDQYKNKEKEKEKEKLIEYSLQVLKTQKTFQLELSDSIKLQDIAEYFLEIQETISMNIGIYSQNKKYYTENQDEEIQNIGTGSDDTYIIIEGDEKEIYLKIKEDEHKKIGKIDFTLIIKRTGHFYQLYLDLWFKVRDVAKYFLELEEIQSRNIVIYSENKKYYSGTEDEELQNIGTGSDDTYFILEGDLND